MHTLLDLSYELLKLENEKEEFVYELLYSHVKPACLANLICSNYYNSRMGRVEPRADQVFQMVIGQENCILQYSSSLKKAVIISKNVQ